MTNAIFARNDLKFYSACRKAGINPTSRQASKYRRGKGAAFFGIVPDRKGLNKDSLRHDYAEIDAEKQVATC